MNKKHSNTFVFSDKELGAIWFSLTQTMLYLKEHGDEDYKFLEKLANRIDKKGNCEIFKL